MSQQQKNELPKKYVFELLPIVFILCMLLLHLLIADKTFSKSEKRYLAQYPTISIETVLDGSYQEKLEIYFSDQFPFRDFWIGIGELLSL